jgi:hypothetical protein
VITIDAKGNPLTKGMTESVLKETKESFIEEAYPKPWEVHLYPDQLIFLAKLKACVFLPTDFQVKHNYPPVQFHGMPVIQDPNFPKNMIEIRDARGKSLAAIRNLATL